LYRQGVATTGCGSGPWKNKANFPRQAMPRDRPAVCATSGAGCTNKPNWRAEGKGPILPNKANSPPVEGRVARTGTQKV